MRTSAWLTLASTLLALTLASGCRSAQTSDIEAARDVDVVYAGEAHDDVAHHTHQVELLRSVTEAARADCVPALFGMEMFQRPFQKHLDDYVAGRIDEREMLRRTEYFARWGGGLRLYAPLWRYCRQNGVRIVALSASRSITQQVVRDGFDSLTPEQRAAIAVEIDFDVPAHRERLMPFFQSDAHRMPEDAAEGMYRSMTIWDETMAESTVNALQGACPGARMLVIAGAKHIQQFSGIPDRVTRRMPESTRLVVVMRTKGREDHDGSVAAAELGDVVVQLAPVAGDPPSRLGVRLAEKPRPEGFVIESVVDCSNAARAGIEAGDVLRFIGRAPITDMTDLRYTLDLTPIGSTLPVRVLRNGTALELSLTFAPPPPPPAHPEE